MISSWFCRVSLCSCVLSLACEDITKGTQLLPVYLAPAIFSCESQQLAKHNSTFISYLWTLLHDSEKAIMGWGAGWEWKGDCQFCFLFIIFPITAQKWGWELLGECCLFLKIGGMYICDILQIINCHFLMPLDKVHRRTSARLGQWCEAQEYTLEDFLPEGQLGSEFIPETAV